MLQISWHRVVLVDSLHANEIISEMWPHSLEISVLSRRHLLFHIRTWLNLRCIHILVDLHVECEQSCLGLILNESINILELLVLVVFTADGANLELISSLSLSYDFFIISEIFPMDIFFIFTALMISSKDILFEVNVASLQ